MTSADLSDVLPADIAVAFSPIPIAAVYGSSALRGGTAPKTEHALTGDVAAKVKAAALAKVTRTVERVETNVDSSAPYEAHITKADGTQVEVQINDDDTVAAVNTVPGHP